MEDVADPISLAFVQSIIAALLSWLVLAGISIIISGKLISLRLPIGIRDDSNFHIPLVIFTIRAKGEEVTSGFLSFILSLISCIFLGGRGAYNLFKDQAGVDIGQWNSLCVMASFLSLLVATLICIVVPFLRGAPLISERDRSETLGILEGQPPND